ncbi:aromatic-ring-hydroxylating dioxygenase subunit beta [Kineococcus sp. SYSU DK001]|uniref:aromatic-ring-hydroxylating dioxygenase subunit beta n=1 Tax=Kineococcus sp. SYSU DK001 TaxID=3383122 RepID=UPI003D7C8636
MTAVDSLSTVTGDGSHLFDGRVAEAIALIWREATLLDAPDYEAWDQLFTPDARYVIPIDPKTTDFEASLNMVYDDERMRKMRVERLVGGYSMSAVAAARTVRTLSRFVVREQAGDELELTSAQVLVGHKRERTFVLGADVTHRIRFVDGTPLIALKVIRLVNSDESVSASGFLL